MWTRTGRPCLPQGSNRSNGGLARPVSYYSLSLTFVVPKRLLFPPFFLDLDFLVDHMSSASFLDFPVCFVPPLSSVFVLPLRSSRLLQINCALNTFNTFKK